MCPLFRLEQNGMSGRYPRRTFRRRYRTRRASRYRVSPSRALTAGSRGMALPMGSASFRSRFDRYQSDHERIFNVATNSRPFRIRVPSDREVKYVDLMSDTPDEPGIIKELTLNDTGIARQLSVLSVGDGKSERDGNMVRLAGPGALVLNFFIRQGTFGDTVAMSHNNVRIMILRSRIPTSAGNTPSVATSYALPSFPMISTLNEASDRQYDILHDRVISLDERSRPYALSLNLSNFIEFNSDDNAEAILRGGLFMIALANYNTTAPQGPAPRISWFGAMRFVDV